MGFARACSYSARIYTDQAKEEYSNADTAAAAGDADPDANAADVAVADTDTTDDADTDSAGASARTNDDPALWYGTSIDRIGSSPPIR